MFTKENIKKSKNSTFSYKKLFISNIAIVGEILDVYTCNGVIFVGDLNRDSKADLFCRDSNGHIHYAFSSSIADKVSFDGILTSPLKWCSGLSDVIVPGKKSAVEKSLE